jgi:hypothetical protein
MLVSQGTLGIGFPPAGSTRVLLRLKNNISPEQRVDSAVLVLRRISCTWPLPPLGSSLGNQYIILPVSPSTAFVLTMRFSDATCAATDQFLEPETCLIFPRKGVKFRLLAWRTPPPYARA